MNLAKEVKQNPKAFWSYTKKCCIIKQQAIPDLRVNDNTICTTDREKADALNSHFSSVFTNEPGGALPEVVNYQGEPMAEITVESNDIEKKLKELNANKSAGPDQLHCRVLKEVASEIAEPSGASLAL